jgi:hypothetical protein
MTAGARRGEVTAGLTARCCGRCFVRTCVRRRPMPSMQDPKLGVLAASPAYRQVAAYFRRGGAPGRGGCRRSSWRRGGEK